MGTKSFVLCCYENEPYTPLLFGTRFNKVKGFFFFFFSVSLPLRHSQAGGARTRDDTMGSRHLEL